MPEQSNSTYTFNLKNFLSGPTGLIGLALILVIAAVLVDRYTNLGPTKQTGENNSANQVQPAADRPSSNTFRGDKGTTVQATNNQVLIDINQVQDGNLRAFNYFSDQLNKTIYFFAVRALDNTYRVAANACEVCYQSKLGFSQVGNQIRCEHCRTTYTKDQIAKQKGGCNPRPIDDNAQVINGKLVINTTDIEKVADLF
jgi:hypothetical protein